MTHAAHNSISYAVKTSSMRQPWNKVQAATKITAWIGTFALFSFVLYRYQLDLCPCHPVCLCWCIDIASMHQWVWNRQCCMDRPEFWSTQWNNRVCDTRKWRPAHLYAANHGSTEGVACWCICCRSVVHANDKVNNTLTMTWFHLQNHQPLMKHHPS